MSGNIRQYCIQTAPLRMRQIDARRGASMNNNGSSQGVYEMQENKTIGVLAYSIICARHHYAAMMLVALLLWVGMLGQGVADDQQELRSLGVLGCGDTQGQKTELYPVCDKGKWGFIDSSGNVVIKPQYDEVRGLLRPNTFSEGLSPAAVKQQDKKLWGFIDSTGKFVIKPVFLDAICFSGGRAAVLTSTLFKKNVWGLIDRQGNYVLEPCLSAPPVFADGLAMMLKQFPAGYFICGYVDEKGKWVIKPDYFGACPFKAGLAIVGPNSKMATKIREDFSNNEYLVIDKAGKIVKSLKYHFVDLTYNFDELVIVTVGSQQGSDSGNLIRFQAAPDSLWGYLDAKGEVAIPPRYKDAGYFSSEGYAPCANSDGLWGVIDSKGTWIVEPQYGLIFSYNPKGLTPVQSKEGIFHNYPDYILYRGNSDLDFRPRKGVGAEWGYMDATGKLVIPFQYTDARYFSNGLAVAGKLNENGEERFGYIKSNGEWLIAPEYLFAGPFRGELAEVVNSIDRKFWKSDHPATIGYVNRSGKQVWQGEMAALGFLGIMLWAQ